MWYEMLMKLKFVPI